MERRWQTKNRARAALPPRPRPHTQPRGRNKSLRFDPGRVPGLRGPDGPPFCLPMLVIGKAPANRLLRCVHEVIIVLCVTAATENFTPAVGDR